MEKNANTLVFQNKHFASSETNLLVRILLEKHFLILEIHFLVLEIHFLILEIQCLILENILFFNIRK